jgi:hypothetical protein
MECRPAAMKYPQISGQNLRHVMGARNWVGTKSEIESHIAHKMLILNVEMDFSSITCANQFKLGSSVSILPPSFSILLQDDR